VLRKFAPPAVGVVLVAGLAAWRFLLPALSATAWTAAAPMPSPLAFHTATLLRDGRVLVAGGSDRQRVSATAAVFVPDGGAGRWERAEPMHVSRSGATATPLPDGRVLVAGGAVDDRSVTATAEIYDPATGRWTATAPMASPRLGHTATPLPDGRVLVAGGFSAFSGTLEFPGWMTPLASAEVFDPGAGTWRPAGPMNVARADHVAVPLRDGEVLVAGGLTPVPPGSQDPRRTTSSAELYDPASGRWRLTGPLELGRSDPVAAVLPDGRVLMAGGSAPYGRWVGYLSAAEVYDPASGSWRAAASMPGVRSDLTLSVLGDGRAIAIGGLDAPDHPLSTTEIYDPRGNRWTSGPQMPIDRSDHTATVLRDGRILATGGLFAPSGRATASAGLLRPPGAR
jgi:Kelch motif/Galactose oxidase, central domain